MTIMHYIHDDDAVDSPEPAAADAAAGAGAGAGVEAGAGRKGYTSPSLSGSIPII